MTTITHPQGGVATGAVRPNAGIDVSKLHLDACWQSQDQRLDNSASGWNELVTKLKAASVDLVVVEARHKDRAKYITAPLDAHRQVLGELMMRRRQLVDMRVAEGNRLDQAGKRATRSILSVIRTLDKQLADVNQDIDKLLEQHFKAQRDLLDSVKGVGPVTILSVTAQLPELGQLDRREIAKLVGVAPLANDSGQRKGKRFTWGGRAEVRAVVYMATLTAIRCNTVLAAFYARLIGNTGSTLQRHLALGRSPACA